MFTSNKALRDDALSTERWNRLHPDSKPRQSWVEQCLEKTCGPVITASDYMRSLGDMIRAWVPRKYTVLGTDGFGRSDGRAALRDFFEVDRHHIVIAALKALADEGAVDRKIVGRAIEKYGIATDRPNPWDT